MTLTNAFSNAASGLIATAKAIQVASANVSNAMTEGYAVRRLELGSAQVGGGVRVKAVIRQVDPALQRLHRDSLADAGAARAGAARLTDLETALGIPGKGIQGAIDALQGALVSASARPDLVSRLEQVASAAQAVSRAFGSAQSALQQSRADADTAIATGVDRLGNGLAQIDALNERIVALKAAGQSTLELEDTRAALVSDLSELVPLREIARADGRITLFTRQGQLMLDLEPAQIGFSRSLGVGPGSSLGAGLSGLTINGIAVATDSRGPLAGGTLTAEFAWRDEGAVAAQAELDALAHDLVRRFGGIDPTLPGTDPGLFTLGGAAAGASVPVGAAGLLSVNAALDGAAWRLRDGLGAAAPGAVGDPAGINALSAAFERVEPTLASVTPARFATHVAETMARLSMQRHAAEEDAASTANRQAALHDQVLANGVDTDAEMQRLLVIEQSYAANARVIETADAMLRRLLEI